MSALAAAVGTDTYGGLSGFRRPTAGNPTRVPSNLPAFRGVPNKPGSNIKAPAIKSSANHPDRKTNVQIPYARVVPVEFPASLGRLSAGDVAFVSKSRPGLPEYACAYQTRLIGVDALNRFMGPDYWTTKIEVGNTYRYLLIDAKMPADDWRKVPSLQEWTLDGVVQSSEEREIFYNASDGKRDNQLYNIAIQGPTMVNNGYVEEHQGWDELARVEQGQIARQQQTFSGSYMDHRVEKFGPHGEMEVDQQWDFAANYQGPQYHLYPQQMFDRGIRPLNKLYIGLVCAEYRFDGTTMGVIGEAIAAQENIKAAVMKVDAANARLSAANAELAAASKVAESLQGLKDAVAAVTTEKASLDRPGSGATPEQKADALQRVAEAQSALRAATRGRSEAEVFAAENAARQKVATESGLLGGAHLEVLALKDELKKQIAASEGEPVSLSEAVRAKTAWAKMGWWSGGARKAEGTDGAPKESFCAFRYVMFTSAQLDEINLESYDNPNGVGMQAMSKNEPVLRTKRQKLGNDPYSDDAQRKRDFRHMVGAWHVGSVLDMKAGKMPWFEGGPSDTGFRVTANVNVHWCDWRELRRKYTPAGSQVQVADALTGSTRWDAIPNMEKEFPAIAEKRNTIVQWPTRWSSDPKMSQAQRDAANTPFDPNRFYQGKAWRPDDAAKERADARDAALSEAEKAAEEADFEVDIPLSTESAIRAGRLARLAVVPPAERGGNLHHSVHIERAGTALKNLALLLAPITAEEIAAHRSNTALPPVARYVMADPPSSAAPTGASSAAAPPLRRDSASTPEPAGVAAPVGAAAASSSGLAPEAPADAASTPMAIEAPLVIEAPAAPAAPAATAGGRKRRPGGSDDVFSTIFGGSSTDAPMQPLNPQHRSDPSGGSSGRSYQRRSKGGGSGGKS